MSNSTSGGFSEEAYFWMIMTRQEQEFGRTIAGFQEQVEHMKTLVAELARRNEELANENKMLKRQSQPQGPQPDHDHRGPQTTSG